MTSHSKALITPLWTSALLACGMAICAACDASRSGPSLIVPTPIGPGSPTPTPAPTPHSSVEITFAGIVREAHVGPLQNVSVVAAPEGNPNDTFTRSTTTDASGAYAIAIPEDMDAVLRFQRDGYYVEERSLGLVRRNSLRSGWVSIMQRITTMAVPGEISSTLLSDDLGRDTGEDYILDYCWPCRIISVSVGGRTQVRVRVQWSGTRALSVWAGDRTKWPMPRGDAPSEASEAVVTATLMPFGDNLILVGLDPRAPVAPGASIPDTPFTMTTEVIP